MAILVSTGLRNKVLDTSPLRTVLNLGFIDLYSGTPPVSADDGIGGGNVKLCRLSVNSTGTGLTMAASAASGVINKAAAEIWSGVNLASGTATFYRHVAPGDDGTTSTTQARVQGTVAQAGADMNLNSIVLASGATQTLDYYVLALPAS
jgi:hypothetical protein